MLFTLSHHLVLKVELLLIEYGPSLIKITQSCFSSMFGLRLVFKVRPCFFWLEVYNFTFQKVINKVTRHSQNPAVPVFKVYHMKCVESYNFECTAHGYRRKVSLEEMIEFLCFYLKCVFSKKWKSVY